MKIKARQYARQGNILGTIIDTDITKTQVAIRQQNSTLILLLDKSKIKVADTPQELIEVGDLVEFKTIEKEDRFARFVRLIENPTQLQVYNENGFINDIIKILTPKGKDYICRWESE